MRLLFDFLHSSLPVLPPFGCLWRVYFLLSSLELFLSHFCLIVFVLVDFIKRIITVCFKIIVHFYSWYFEVLVPQL